jgi:hypothetical protein
MTRQILSRQHSSPKTVLGFFGACLAILAAADVPIIAVLARKQSLHYLIPYALIIPLVILVLVVVVVLMVVIFGDPTKLMLGEMTGSEYGEYQRMMVGDSISGARPIIDQVRGPQATGGTAIPLSPGDDT